MALTGKTIGELTLLNNPTNNTLIPVEESGVTYHIAFSSINYTELTYSDLLVGMSAGELSIGHYYLITDFKTCYDQPDYDYIGNPITVGNYKQGSVSPILVLAISNSTISELAYQPQYSGDTIYYDPYFSVTEVTGGEAFGRIIYRIDDKGNAFDYDFREVLFKRYDTYSSSGIYSGKVNIDGSGNVTGVGTFFTSRAPGEIIGIVNTNSPYCMDYYEVVSVGNDTSMIVTGHTINSLNDVFYAPSTREGFMSYKQSNIISNTAFTEYNTFTTYENCFNNVCGNREDFTKYEVHTFLLSNNVFRDSPYVDNSFGSNFRNNTFNDDCTGNSILTDFYNNVIDNDFDRNIITSQFYENMIVCNFQNNHIQDNFYRNNLGDDDGVNFNDCTIEGNFYSNFYTGRGDFQYNTIYGDFYANYILGNLSDNNIKGGFSNNKIFRNIYSNYIGNNFIVNNINAQINNCEIGDDFQFNTISSNFLRNTIGFSFQSNNLGDPNNSEFYTFESNIIGSFCQSNYFSGDTSHNTIGDWCTSNNIDTNFSFNRIGSYFQGNSIANDFGFGGGQYRGNVIGNGFQSNTIGEYFYDNTIADSFVLNQVSDFFINNKVSYGWSGCIFADLDTSGQCRNNSFLFTNHTVDLTFSGGTGGNPILYTAIPANITLDASDSNVYVTFLSGGTIISQPIIV